MIMMNSINSVKITNSTTITTNSNKDKLTVYDDNNEEIGRVIKKEIVKPKTIENYDSIFYNDEEFTIDNNDRLVKRKSLKR